MIKEPVEGWSVPVEYTVMEIPPNLNPNFLHPTRLILLSKGYLLPVNVLRISFKGFHRSPSRTVAVYSTLIIMSRPTPH
ncbi:hypothetical protein KL86CLO1_11655 [uncultured Eubacteriales bacterium]|uniref:Uncharacterized protein n=1 Tax=uncultured Eubacteriales bacterium TaxID=172733 RepID=A0A212JSS5_9FIRM|nr:hypothetical protein KL86CLO1_11655 [uncultured Eubacteriales bacterium]